MERSKSLMAFPESPRTEAAPLPTTLIPSLYQEILKKKIRNFGNSLVFTKMPAQTVKKVLGCYGDRDLPVFADNLVGLVQEFVDCPDLISREPSLCFLGKFWVRR